MTLLISSPETFEKQTPNNDSKRAAEVRALDEDIFNTYPVPEADGNNYEAMQDSYPEELTLPSDTDKEIGDTALNAYFDALTDSISPNHDNDLLWSQVNSATDSESISDGDGLFSTGEEIFGEVESNSKNDSHKNISGTDDWI